MEVGKAGFDDDDQTPAIATEGKSEPGADNQRDTQ